MAKCQCITVGYRPNALTGPHARAVCQRYVALHQVTCFTHVCCKKGGATVSVRKPLAQTIDTLHQVICLRHENSYLDGISKKKLMPLTDQSDYRIWSSRALNMYSTCACTLYALHIILILWSSLHVIGSLTIPWRLCISSSG